MRLHTKDAQQVCTASRSRAEPVRPAGRAALLVEGLYWVDLYLRPSQSRFFPSVCAALAASLDAANAHITHFISHDSGIHVVSTGITRWPRPPTPPGCTRSDRRGSAAWLGRVLVRVEQMGARIGLFFITGSSGKLSQWQVLVRLGLQSCRLEHVFPSAAPPRRISKTVNLALLSCRVRFLQESVETTRPRSFKLPGQEENRRTTRISAKSVREAEVLHCVSSNSLRRIAESK